MKTMQKRLKKLLNKVTLAIQIGLSKLLNNAMKKMQKRLRKFLNKVTLAIQIGLSRLLNNAIKKMQKRFKISKQAYAKNASKYKKSFKEKFMD